MPEASLKGGQLGGGEGNTRVASKLPLLPSLTPLHSCRRKEVVMVVMVVVVMMKREGVVMVVGVRC